MIGKNGSMYVKSTLKRESKVGAEEVRQWIRRRGHDVECIGHREMTVKMFRKFPESTATAVTYFSRPCETFKRNSFM